MIETVKIGKNRLANGKFAPGNIANPNGRPPAPEIDELRQALEMVKKKHNKSFLQHFCERAFVNDNVAVALAKKIIPDRIAHEGEAMKMILQFITYGELKQNADNSSAGGRLQTT